MCVIKIVRFPILRFPILLYKNLIFIVICSSITRHNQALVTRRLPPCLILTEKIGVMKSSSEFSGQWWRIAAVFQLSPPARLCVVLFWKRQSRGGRVLKSRSQHQAQTYWRTSPRVQRQRSSQCSWSPLTNLASPSFSFCPSLSLSLSLSLLWLSNGLLASDSSCVLTACSVPPDTRYNAAGIRQLSYCIITLHRHGDQRKSRPLQV